MRNVARPPAWPRRARTAAPRAGSQPSAAHLRRARARPCIAGPTVAPRRLRLPAQCILRSAVARVGIPLRRHRALPARVEPPVGGHRDEPRPDSRTRSPCWQQAQALWADHLAERAKADGVLRAPEECATPRAWRKTPTRTIDAAQVHRQAHVHRPDLHEPQDGVRRLPARHAVRRAGRHSVRPVEDGESRAESVHPALQAGVAARVAAARHHDRERALRDRRARCSRSRS